MASANDTKIKSLLEAIESKKKAMGTKPKATWETNGVINGRNINTINSVDVCVELASALMMTKGYYEQACDFLDVEVVESEAVKGINDALTDVKLRAKIIQWDAEKKKLQAMEKKLKDLRSEDAKTEDALGDIAGALGL